MRAAQLAALGHYDSKCSARRNGRPKTWKFNFSEMVSNGLSFYLLWILKSDRRFFRSPGKRFSVGSTLKAAIGRCTSRLLDVSTKVDILETTRTNLFVQRLLFKFDGTLSASCDALKSVNLYYTKANSCCHHSNVPSLVIGKKFEFAESKVKNCSHRRFPTKKKNTIHLEVTFLHTQVQWPG